MEGASSAYKAPSEDDRQGTRAARVQVTGDLPQRALFVFIPQFRVPFLAFHSIVLPYHLTDNATELSFKL